MFLVPTNSKYCVVATRPDGTKYLVHAHSDEASALSFVAERDDLTVVYSPVLDLLKSL